MKFKSIAVVSLLSCLAPAALQAQANQTSNQSNMDTANSVICTVAIAESAPSLEAMIENPLLAKWEGRYGGTPLFDRVKVADFKPALEAGMAEKPVSYTHLTLPTKRIV